MVVETVVRLKSQGHKVVLVSSGAIGVGLKRMEIPIRPKNLSGKQASRTFLAFLSEVRAVIERVAFFLFLF